MLRALPEAACSPPSQGAQRPAAPVLQPLAQLLLDTRCEATDCPGRHLLHANGFG